jgi:hypothetical protein
MATQPLTFAVVGDLHVGSGSEVVQTMIRLVNDRPLDFVLFLGDLTHTAAEDEVAAFAEQVRRIRPLVYLTIGNHDTARFRDGFDIERRLGEMLPGPWGDAFTYGFEAKGWRFVVVTARSGKVDEVGYQVNNVKGSISERGGIIRVPKDQMRRVERLLGEPGNRPTCFVSHVPLVPMPRRIFERGCFDQVRYIEEHHLLSLLDHHPNVKLALAGHQHFNQADVRNGVLHCVTQGVRGYPPYQDPDRIRIVELSDAGMRSYLVWDGVEPEPPAPLGTLDGDRSFRWEFS